MYMPSKNIRIQDQIITLVLSNWTYLTKDRFLILLSNSKPWITIGYAVCRFGYIRLPYSVDHNYTFI